MRKTLLDISGKIDKHNLEVLLKIKAITDELRIEYFIVGATVRDMILNYIYGIDIYRATNDIDFAVRVRNWEEYKLLIEKVREAGFREDERILHRYYFDGLIIDFIPFGDISNNDEIIIWPDNDQREMSIIGFNDAYMNTENILIKRDPDVLIKAVSVEGLVMLKMFSWNDRYLPMRLKDAKDLYLIISTYLRAGNEERLFNEHQDIVEQATDYELSGAMLLGRDIKQSVSEKVYTALLKILEDNTLNLLAQDMSKTENLHKETDDEKVEWCLSLLHNFKLGLTGKVS